MKRTISTFAIASQGVWVLVLVAGCGQGPTAAPSPKVSATSIHKYKLTGVVRKVDPASGVVTIAHEAVPGIKMGAMTMPFTVKNKELLDDMHPDDEVEGCLRVEKENDEVKDWELTDLLVTRPAPPPSLKLSISGGAAEVSAAVKVLEPGQAVPDFAFTTQDGTQRKLSNFRGKVVVLTFIYTRCPLPDFCPAMDRKFAELADRLSAISSRAEKVRLLSMSFDPEHDTPAILREHARIQGAKPPLWTFAVATHPELYKVMRELGFSYGPTEKEIIHNLSTAVIDQEGRLARLEQGKEWKPLDLLKIIVPMLKASPQAADSPTPK